jgi:hypothetical protein
VHRVHRLGGLINEKSASCVTWMRFLAPAGHTTHRDWLHLIVRSYVGQIVSVGSSTNIAGSRDVDHIIGPQDSPVNTAQVA